MIDYDYLLEKIKKPGSYIDIEELIKALTAAKAQQEAQVEFEECLGSCVVNARETSSALQGIDVENWEDYPIRIFAYKVKEPDITEHLVDGELYMIEGKKLPMKYMTLHWFDGHYLHHLDTIKPRTHNGKPVRCVEAT